MEQLHEVVPAKVAVAMKVLETNRLPKADEDVARKVITDYLTGK